MIRSAHISPLLRSTITVVILSATLFLGGCGESELYTGLTEREANEMIAVLQSGDISASKSTADSKTWTVQASKDDFPRAVALLQGRGYPRDRFESLGDVFKKQGFVSSPLEEHARLIYGLSQELSNTISQIDGVVDARVLISVPEVDPMSDQQKPASASVFIKYDPQMDLSGQVAPIKALVVNSIEGLPYDRVTVVMVAARPLPAPAAPASISRLGGPLAAMLGVVAAGLGLQAWRRLRRERPRAVGALVGPAELVR